MASLRRLSNSPYWIACYTLPDGRRTQRSTRTHDKKEAMQMAMTWEKASRLAMAGKLGIDQARAVIAAGVADILAMSGQTMPTSTVKDWCARWLETKAVENEKSTCSRYELAINAFLESLGTAADRDLSQISTKNILSFREWCGKKLSVGSINTHLRVIRACLNAATRNGLIDKNPACQVAALKEKGESKRRALNAEEIQKVLHICNNTPWRGLVLTGLYTGQRLGDCARLRWGQVDLQKRTISFVTQKTGKRLSMCMATPLADYFESIPISDDPNGSVFPTFARMAEKSVSSLSNAFAIEVMIPAGLMQARPDDKKSSGKGRSGLRQVNEVTFHSLRHSFVTMLKATGASNALAQMIVGHNSTAVSQRYTHLSSDDTRESISRLPDITKDVQVVDLKAPASKTAS
jgi:integrase